MFCYKIRIMWIIYVVKSLLDEKILYSSSRLQYMKTKLFAFVAKLCSPYTIYLLPSIQNCFAILNERIFVAVFCQHFNVISKFSLKSIKNKKWFLFVDVAAVLVCLQILFCVNANTACTALQWLVGVFVDICFCFVYYLD